MRRVAVTGIGVIAPGGNNAEAFFGNLIAGRSAVGVMPEERTRRLTTRIGAEVAFDPAGRFAAPRLRMLDRVSQLALIAASEAVASSGLELDAALRDSAGIYFGTGMGGAQTTDDEYAAFYGERSDRIRPFTVLMAMTNAAASWIGIELGLDGPNLTFSTACSSSAVAVGEAWLRIRSGAADVMLAGGAEAPLTPGTIKAWEALKTLALEDAGDPAASCKPFAADRTGLVLGEGAAVIVLEDWDRAKRRGATVHGELVGYGLCADTAHITRPTVVGQARAMRLALGSAGIAPERVGYINAHGTGTVANDATETAAIRQVFGAGAERIPVSSTKSMHGHLLGAAGAVELIVTLLALREAITPPTLNLHRRDPDCDLDYVPNVARELGKHDYAMSNSFAFGVTTAVLICRRA
jgi:3-oxoacyl-[acyl-carrier-protein] synthase II